MTATHNADEPMLEKKQDMTQHVYDSIYRMLTIRQN